ncbi:MAG: hypothetical protein ACP5XB_32010, partial [Isosphaeraceae bacterium]
LVIEDTEVRSVHTLNLPEPGQPHVARAKLDGTDGGIGIGAQRISVKDFEPQTACPAEMPNSTQAFCPAACRAADNAAGAPIKDLETGARLYNSGDMELAAKHLDAARMHQDRLKMEERVVLNAYLKDLHKYVGFSTEQASAHATSKEPCCADDKACAAQCHLVAASCCSSEKPKRTAKPARFAQVQIPEIGRAEIAGEWLIPHDEVLLVGFGPHTVADKDGKAVVRELLAMVTATEISMPKVEADSEPLGLPRPLPKVARPTTTALPSPALPSRSLPQGFHADGTPAALPPLPEDDKVAPSPDESAEPRPSPQKHKAPSSKPPVVKPATPSDSKTTKATFLLPGSLFKQTAIPAIGIPNVQFMMPLKPFEIRLPFNQKLQLDLIGRVVADDQAAEE